MLRQLISISIVVAFALFGFVISFYVLPPPIATLSSFFILLISSIAIYFSRPTDGDKSPSARAITAIAGLTGTNPLWAKLISVSLPTLPNMLPDLITKVEVGFILSSSLGVLAITSITWISLRDPTIGGRKGGRLSKEIGEIGFNEKLFRMAQVLEARLNNMDDESNWTDQAFTPLDAEIEKTSLSGRRPRRIVDLISAIRSDHSAVGFLILGDPGSGKSVAMRRLAREMLKEVRQTLILPIYINLKEWNDSHQLTSDGKIDVFQFIKHYLKITGNDLIMDFVETYLTRLLEVGRLFILFDSFDETPALLDQDESSTAIAILSKNLEEFLIGPHKSRCVIASRYFRRPRFSSSEVSVLEILPLSDRKIRDALIRSNRLSRGEIDRFLTSRTRWLSYAKNPFVANLVVDYMAIHNGQLPIRKIEVYDSYVHARLQRVSYIVTKYNLSDEEILKYATVIAFEMFSRANVGLEVGLMDVREWIQEAYKLNKTRDVIDVLVRARLVRSSAYPEERISFVHRRFNEFFLALAAKQNLMPIDCESIAMDKRDRDALVLYVELADDPIAMSILRFCWDQMTAERGRLRATYCLRFIVEAFTSSKRHLVSVIADDMYSYLNAAVAQHADDMLRAKIAVESAGVLEDDAASEIIRLAVETRNFWITEAAIRATRGIDRITSASKQRIRRYLLEMSDFEVLKQRRDLVDVFRLNSSFGHMFWLVNARAVAVVLQWPIRVVAIGLLPLLYSSALFAWCYLICAALISQGARDWVQRKINKQTGHLMWESSWLFDSTSVFACALLIVVIRFVGINVQSLIGKILATVGIAFSDGPRIGWGTAAVFICASISVKDWTWAVVIVRRGISSLRDNWLGIREMYGMVVGKVSEMWRKWRWSEVVEVIKAITIPLSVMGGIWIVALVVKEYFGELGVRIVGGGMLLVMICVPGVTEAIAMVREIKMVKSVIVEKMESRESIGVIFSGLRFSYSRKLFVEKVEAYHRKNGTRPHGGWKEAAAPNFGDKASIRLSQLDETWAGLDR